MRREREIAEHAEITENTEQPTDCCGFSLLPLFPCVPCSLLLDPFVRAIFDGYAVGL